MIDATSISECWFLVLKELRDSGYEVGIDRGSYAGSEVRLQLPWLSGRVRYPLYDMIPSVPYGVPQPVDSEYLDRYFKDKLIGSEKGENEEYTYGERIFPQLESIIEILGRTPFTNQAVIEVGKEGDLGLEHPPCLRVITFKVVKDNRGKKRLNTSVYFRSWDLWNGFPANLGGIALLANFICGFIEDLSIGDLYFASDGAHVYSYAIEYMDRVLHIER